MSLYHCSKGVYCDSWEKNEEPAISRATTMQRYLQEQDRPWFTSLPADNDDPTTHALPGDPYDGSKYTERGLRNSYHNPRRIPSPTSSGLESTGVSSSWSDRQGTPWSSPEVHQVSHALELAGAHETTFGDPRYIDQDSHYGGSCVAMNDVQKYADHQTDNFAFEDDPVAGYSLYGSFAQEGYQPLPQSLDDQMLDTNYSIPSTAYPTHVQQSRQASPRSESEAPIIRRRRPQPSRAVTSPSRTSRVNKRVQMGRRSSFQTSARSERSSDRPPTPSSSIVFPCPLQTYGCMSTFGSKNEWKRHVTTQHMRLGFWRCEWCPERKPNDFNRKDLFIQHVRRMHPNEIVHSRAGSIRKSVKDTTEEQASNSASVRCYRQLRSPPESSCCLLCDLRFDGPGSWEERMEHLGRHLEAAKKGTEESISSQDWRVDTHTHAWLVKEGIVVPGGEQWVLADRT